MSSFANDCLDVARVASNAIPVVRTTQCTCDEIQIQLKDPNTGEPCNLTEFGIGPEPESSDSSSSSSDDNCGLPEWCSPSLADDPFTGVQIITKAFPSDSAMPINKAAVIKTEEDATAGIVYLQLEPAESALPGMWGAMAIVRQCNVARKGLPFFFEIMPSLDQINIGSGPLSIYEVRIAIRDSDPLLNNLIDALDFQDFEVAFMIRKAIDIWREIPPHTVAEFTMADFPFRHHWIEVTIGQLMLMASDHMRRNDLDYKAAGLTIEDTKKWPYYQEVGQKRMEEFKAWAIQTKMTINLEGGFASLGGYRQIVQR